MTQLLPLPRPRLGQRHRELHDLFLERFGVPSRKGVLRTGSGASADNSLRSAAEALKGTLVSDGKRLEIRHFCFAACGSSIRQEVFAGPKSLDAPEPVRRKRPLCRLMLKTLSTLPWHHK